MGPHVRPCWHRQERIPSCRRSRESIQQYLWSCTGYIDIDIIVGGIVTQAESATENGFPMSGQEPAPLRGVSEADARPPAILRRRDQWERAHGERKRRIPECSGCVAFALGGDIVKKVSRLTVIGPGDTKIQGQMALNLEVVSEVKEGILFPEVERGIARSDANAVWNILSEGSPVREAELAVDIGKENVGGTLIREVNASLQSVPAHKVGPIVLTLVAVDNAPLGSIGRWTESKQGRIAETNLCQGLGNVSLKGDGVSD